MIYSKEFIWKTNLHVVHKVKYSEQDVSHWYQVKSNNFHVKGTLFFGHPIVDHCCCISITFFDFNYL